MQGLQENTLHSLPQPNAVLGLGADIVSWGRNKTGAAGDEEGGKPLRTAGQDDPCMYPGRSAVRV